MLEQLSPLLDVDRPVPGLSGRQLQIGFLNFAREAVIRKLDGLDEEQNRWLPADQAGDLAAISLIGIVNHLTHMEQYWMQGNMLGEPITGGPDEFEPSESITTHIAIQNYRKQALISNDLLGTLPFTELCKREERKDLNLQWVMVHMQIETARHAGHADIVRELLDNKTGE